MATPRTLEPVSFYHNRAEPDHLKSDDFKLSEKYWQYNYGHMIHTDHRNPDIGVYNVPNQTHINNATALAKNIIEPIVDHFDGMIIWITSWFRSRDVHCRIAGDSEGVVRSKYITKLKNYFGDDVPSDMSNYTSRSSYTIPEIQDPSTGILYQSQHEFGQAVDIVVSDVYKSNGVTNTHVFYYIINNLNFDQCILENWEGSDARWVHVSYDRNKSKQRKDFKVYINGTYKYVGDIDKINELTSSVVNNNYLTKYDESTTTEDSTIENNTNDDIQYDKEESTDTSPENTYEKLPTKTIEEFITSQDSYTIKTYVPTIKDIDNKDRINASKDGATCIGDIWLQVPPDQITINRIDQIQTIPTIRTISDPVQYTGHGISPVHMSLEIVDDLDINYQLRNIAAMAKYSPLISVYNKHLYAMFGIYLEDNTVIDFEHQALFYLSNLTLQSSPSNPGNMQVSLVLEPYGHNNWGHERFHRTDESVIRYQQQKKKLFGGICIRNKKVSRNSVGNN